MQIAVLNHEPRLDILKGAFSSSFSYVKPDKLNLIPEGYEHCDGFITGAIYSADGTLVETSLRGGGKNGDRIGERNETHLSRPSVKNAQKYSGRSLYLGFFMAHYGHFITEGLSRIWIPQIDIEKFQRFVVFPFVFGTKIEEFHKYFLERLGVDASKVVFLREAAEFEEIWVTEQLWGVNSSVHASLRPLYRRLAEPFVDEKAETSKKLFIGRSDAVRQRVDNAAEIEELFRKEKYEIIYPENLNITDQLYKYSNCETMAGMSGSGLHNIVFAPKCRELIEVADQRTARGFLPMQVAANALTSARIRRVTVEGGIMLPASVVESGAGQPGPAEKKVELSRAQILNRLLALYKSPDYLEVGVNRGDTFKAIRANTRTAVDPKFLFDSAEWASRDPSCSFHEIPSDAFFAEVAGDRRYDVIYLDGLHTFEQTLRDFLNAEHLLKEDGIIVIDDVRPNSYLASLPSHAEFRRLRAALGITDRSWMGDVFKLIYFIRSFCVQFSYATVSECHGVAVVWRQRRKLAEGDDILVRDVAEKSFADLMIAPEVYNTTGIDDIVKAVAAWKGSRSRA